VRNTKPSLSKKSSRQKVRKSTFSKPPSASTSSTPTEFENKNDIDALEAFCKDVDLKELAFSEWEVCFESLDIIVPIWIGINDGTEGCEKTVAFTRSTRVDPKGTSIREKIQLLIQIPRGSLHLSRISIPRQGDVRGGQQGDLILIIHIKN
jgi:hypothetical protein